MTMTHALTTRIYATEWFALDNNLYARMTPTYGKLLGTFADPVWAEHLAGLHNKFIMQGEL